MDQGFEQKRRPHPKASANVISYLFFSYMVPLFWHGYKNDITEKDIYQVIKKLKSKRISEKLIDQWKLDLKQRGKTSVLRLLCRCYGKRFAILSIIQCIVITTFNIVKPLAIGKLILFFTPGQTELTRADAQIYAFILIGLSVFKCFYIEHFDLAKSELAIDMKMAFTSLVYRKSLSLSSDVISEISIGKIVTVVTKDLHGFDFAIYFGITFWVEIIQAVVVSYLIYNKIGNSAFVGIGAIIFGIVIQGAFGKYIYWKRGSTNKKCDERLQLTQQILAAIKIIKLYTWETFFCQKINHARKKEMKELRKIFLIRDFAVTLGGLVANISYYLLFIVYLWMGNRLTAELLYYVSSCYNRLRITIKYLIPMGIGEIAELLASLKRVNYILNSEDTTPKEFKMNNFMQPKILLSDLTVGVGDRICFENLQLHFEPGLNVIAGPVGSGKSMLVKTILQEYKIVRGNIFINGEISYASQEPWLFPSSIRQNILFGLSYDKERYDKVVDVCSLRLDFEMFADGDRTIIGDCGMNLSKGQQSRINLARCIYRQSEIYILDDSLSALDINVQKDIFFTCIREFLKKKLVIFVSHNNAFLKDADKIVILNNRKVVYSGEFDNVAVKNLYNFAANDGYSENITESPANETKKDKDIPLVPMKNIYLEEKKQGSVDWRIYKKYLLLGGPFLMALIILIQIFVEGVRMTGEKLMSQWTNMQKAVNTSTNGLPYQDDTISKNYSMMFILCGIAVTDLLARLVESILYYIYCTRVSINLHKLLAQRVLNADIQFFDQNMIGNILNRFSKDLSVMDENIPWRVKGILQAVFMTLGSIGLIITVKVLFLVLAVLLFSIYVVIGYFYMPTARSLKRLDSIVRSPIIGQINATLTGLESVRAFKKQDILIEEFNKHQDKYISVMYMLQTSARWLSISLNIVCVIFTSSIILTFLYFIEGTLAGDVGMVLTQSFTLGLLLQWGVENYVQLESQMTSLERVMEYAEVPQENKKGTTPDNWPNKGKITFDNVNLTYRLNNEQVLQNVTFTIKPGQKVGIVGRTGAGKSSIIVTLFRLYQIDGKIKIDDLDIAEVSLEHLRSRISIIPQDPIIFQGSMRSNLDPYDRYTDSNLWSALEAVGLKTVVKNLDGDLDLREFSLGQKQLICLARAIVQENKIIILDEATSNMDMETESLIQKKINEIFGNCTVIMVAHRMDTVLHCDQVMVMDKGRLIEMDNPQELISRETGEFYKMVRSANILKKND